MGNKKLKTRNEIAPEFKWRLEKMYSDDGDWEKDLSDAESLAADFSKFKGHLGESPSILADALETGDKIELKLERAFVYARMKLDEDNRVAKHQAMHDRSKQSIAKISAALSFITPELISLPGETLLSYLEREPRLQVYEHMFHNLLRQKDHVLSSDEETLMAQIGEVLGATDTIFTMLNDADMKFGKITDENGEEVTLTHGNYINFMRSHNRKVREDTYKCCYTSYKNLINTLAANYSYNVKTDVVTSKIRKYPSSRNAALSGGNISEEVYDNLVSAVHDALPAMHEYIALRKKILGVDELKMHDVYVPLVELPERYIPFEDAISISMQGLAPLGKEYLTQFKSGIDNGWVDIYENEGKTSGAYSFGSYDSDPFVLMNYNNRLEDVFTLVHEMGHSMNSYYTRKHQPFVYGDHSIFTAEVASTVNESLLMKHLLSTEKDDKMHKHILNMYIEAFRTTLFRQTMFAEFEHKSHKYVEEGGSLTAEWLNKTYDDLNTLYFGPALTHDDLIQYEWSRIPHFYRSFYVYQYATGYSAATAISKLILENGEEAKNAYIEFLKCGTNDYPVELLKIAGVDMASKEPVDKAMETFKNLVDELKGLF